MDTRHVPEKILGDTTMEHNPVTNIHPARSKRHGEQCSGHGLSRLPSSPANMRKVDSISPSLWREKPAQKHHLLKFPKILMTPDPYDFVGVNGQWTQIHNHTSPLTYTPQTIHTLRSTLPPTHILPTGAHIHTHTRLLHTYTHTHPYPTHVTPHTTRSTHSSTHTDRQIQKSDRKERKED